MATGTTIAIIAGIAVFGIVAYLIIKEQAQSNIFGDLTGLAGAL